MRYIALASLIGFLAVCAVRPALSEEVEQAGVDVKTVYQDAVDAFERGDVERSASLFDEVVRIQPEQLPNLWQRGISLYYTGRWEDCVAQFVSHRAVNGDDVENSIWHYLCVAALAGEEAARKGFFPADDRRLPMMALHRFYSGGSGMDEVFAEVEGSQDERRQHLGAFYAHLYIALWYESRGDAERTRQHLEKSLDGPEVGHYMEIVARVHLERIRRGRHHFPKPRKTTSE